MGSDRAVAEPQQTHTVSIHAPAWGAPPDYRHFDDAQIVSIHAPAWGATILTAARRLRAWFQFTLPHGERRPRRRDSADSNQFQFTLPHGERRGLRGSRFGGGGFNSRSRMGSDAVQAFSLPPCRCFNSRSRMGSDQCRRRRRPRHLCFNSRSRMGSDAAAAARAIYVSIHAPAWGATPPRDRGPIGPRNVSIHAPAWGAT